MPTGDTFLSKASIKMLLLGDSGTGKTGALASLVKAGYKLRIWDFDEGLPYMMAIVKRDAPDKLKNISYQPFKSDKWSLAGQNIVYQGAVSDFSKAVQQLDNWSEPGNELGAPKSWDLDTIVVLDSLTFFSKAAYRYSDSMNPGAKDKRQIYYHAQQNVAAVLAKLTASDFLPHVIVICHIDYQETEGMGIKKGYPRSIGAAMNPEIPAYFNTALQTESIGSGPSTKRVIKTAPTGLVDLKTSIIISQGELPLDTGLAAFFASAKAAATSAK